jgi:ankyrin repeat protein
MIYIILLILLLICAAMLFKSWVSVTPAIAASEKGLTKLPGASGILVNQANKNGWTPLYIASEKGHVEVVTKLLQVMYQCFLQIERWTQ